MPFSWHQNRMKIYTQESISPFSKGGEGDLNFFLFRHSDCVTIPFTHQEELESGGYSTFIFSFLVIYSQYYCKILT
jgi:hypothetical protein